MGVEEEFLLRFGDTTIKPNQIQLAGGGFPVTGKQSLKLINGIILLLYLMVLQ